MHQVRWKILQKKKHPRAVCSTCICPSLGSILILDAWFLLKSSLPKYVWAGYPFGSNPILIRIYYYSFNLKFGIDLFPATRMPTIIWGASAHPMSSSFKDGQNLNYQLSLLQCCQWVFDRLFWHSASLSLMGVGVYGYAVDQMDSIGLVVLLGLGVMVSVVAVDSESRLSDPPMGPMRDSIPSIIQVW